MLNYYKSARRVLTDVSRSVIWNIRLTLIRGRAGLRLQKRSHIAWSARFDFNSDGWRLGGSISAGPGLRLCSGAILSPYGGRIVIGRNVYIGPYCILYGHGGLTIGDNVQVAGHCTIVPSNHNFSDIDRPIAEQGETLRGITIDDDVWFGSGCRILDGVRIGKGAVVAAGAVVTASVEPFAIVAGVPARVIRYRDSGDTDPENVQAAS